MGYTTYQLVQDFSHQQCYFIWERTWIEIVGAFFLAMGLIRHCETCHHLEKYMGLLFRTSFFLQI